MKILALEFSSPERSAAVWDDVAGRLLGAAAEAGGGHTQAFGLIERALQQGSLTRAQVDGMAVGLGPGSYTGIRIAIAIAQGWQLARAIQVQGVNSADCLAHQAAAEGLTGRVHVLMDAQRNEFYLATYALDPAGVHLVEPLVLATVEETHARCRTGGTPVGFDVQCRVPSARLLFPHAATLARLAAARRDFVSGDQLAPIYLRPVSFVKAPPPRILS